MDSYIPNLLIAVNCFYPQPIKKEEPWGRRPHLACEASDHSVGGILLF